MNSNKPKILLIIGTTHLGGAPVQAYQTAKSLRGDIDFILVAPDDGLYFKKFQDLGIQTIRAQLRRVRPPSFLSVVRTVQRNGVQLIHSHGKAAGLYSRISGWLTGVPVIHTFHGIHFKKYGIFSPLYLGIEKILGKMTAKFIAVAEHEKETAIKHRFAKPEQIEVIYNGVPQVDIPQKRSNPKNFNIVSVGRFFSGKGQEFLIAAMPDIIRSIPDARLILVGDGPKLGTAKEQAKKLEIDRHIDFVGDREDVYDYLACADIYVAPSLGEGLPLTLLEAGQAGLPIIATDVTGNNEVVQDKISGLLIPPKDPASIIRSVIELYHNPDQAKKYSSALQKTVREKFSFSKMVEKTLDLYNRVLQKND